MAGFPSPQVTSPAPAGRPARDRTRPAWRATLALARVEGLRLPRHPLVLVAAALLVWPWAAGLRHRDDTYPVLHHADIGTQQALLLLAAAVLIAANLAVLRAHRHGAEPLYGTLALPAWRRTLAHLLSLLPVTLLGAALASAHLAQLATVPGAVGRPNPVELATGPVLVALAGALGILLARLARSALVALLALLVLVSLLYFALWSPTLGDGGLDQRLWLGPLVPNTWSGPDDVPADLLGRPAGWHLAYLAGVVLLVAAAALVRAGGPRRPLAGVGAAALALVAVAGPLQLRPPPPELAARRVAAMERPSTVQVCQRRGPVTYCLFGEFAPMVDGWDPAVQAVLRPLPPGTAPRLVVRQQINPLDPALAGRLGQIDTARLEDDRRAGTPDSIPVFTVTGIGGASELPLSVAYRAVGSPTVGGPEPAGAQDPERVACGAPGVVALWLAGRSSEAAESDMRTVLGQAAADPTADPDGFNLILSNGPQWITVGAYEAALALALLDHPDEQVERSLRRNWQELTSPATSSSRAAELLGVDPPGAAVAHAEPKDC